MLVQGAKDGRQVGGEESEVIFVRENVSMHPTQDASQRISGRFRILKQSSSLFMTWIPYTQKGNLKVASDMNNNKSSERDRNLYSIRAVPLAEVKSIWRHTRPLVWQYIIVVLNCGLAFPPLYFHNGGIKELLNKLKEHVHMVRSLDDANLYLLNDVVQDPLQKSLSSLELRDVVPVTSVAVAQNQLLAAISSENGSSKINTAISVSNESTGYEQRKLYSRRVGRQEESRPSAQQSHCEREQMPQSDSKFEETTISDEMASTRVGSFELVESKLNDYSLSVWGRARLPPLENEEWATFLDSEGRVVDSKALRKRIFYGGLGHRLRREVWKFLLGYHQYDSTYMEREELRTKKYKEYKLLKAQWQTISADQAKRFAKFRERKSRVEKDVVRTDRILPFYAGDDNQNVSKLHDILVTYSFYNFDIGYCQGMSDFLSPILFVMEDESESFWCFVALMEHLAPNFNRDQNGMHSQLLAVAKLVELLDSPLHKYLKQADCLNYFFCFRWILIQFKREFEYENVMRLWEVLWTHYLTEHFHLYICVALLKKYRRKIVDEQMDFDCLLRFINGLSGHLNLEAVLRDAESLCILAGDSGVACIPAGTPPSLPVPML
ncbi:hypothetical protein GOP47_0005903 [Adiantum capillus-veneris]|uniref:TBC1 domain family member 15 n=1 Tax=Adiantum capillus-veneris TaxID=13818 RepID=A0A9D4ZLI9_ADICA|nr:hypothetical protein GOP47_0005903 [Adiantum capillus-veneris]